jgi:type II secretory pathway component PulF
MELRSWLQQWLGIGNLHQQIAQLDRRIGSIETDVASTLQHFGKYRGRTDEELALMRSQLETMLETVSNVIAAVESQADKQRAVRLKARLRYNLTKVNNAYANRIA